MREHEMGGNGGHLKINVGITSSGIQKDCRDAGLAYDEHPMADALETSGIWSTKEYIQRRQATIVAQVACRPIYKLCTGAERIPGSSRFMKKCDQDMGRDVE